MKDVCDDLNLFEDDEGDDEEGFEGGAVLGGDGVHVGDGDGGRAEAEAGEAGADDGGVVGFSHDSEDEEYGEEGDDEERAKMREEVAKLIEGFNEKVTFYEPHGDTSRNLWECPERNSRLWRPKLPDGSQGSTGRNRIQDVQGY